MRAPSHKCLTSDAVVLQVLLVDSDYALEEALDALRESMNDSIVAIDLEWTPDVVSGFYSFVALMQLASSTRAVLIRLCCMDGMPYMLEQFLRCCFSWSHATERCEDLIQ